MGWRTYFSIFLILLPRAVLSAQDTTIPTVKVKAKLPIAGGHKTFITRDQWQQTGAITLTQVLRNSGSVQIQDTTGSGNQASMSLRGFGANASSNTLLLINGIPITNPDMAPPNLNIIPLNDIESVEVIAGSESVLYGDQAVGGIINILSRYHVNEIAQVSCSGGSYDFRQCNAGFSKQQGRLNLHMTALVNSTDNYREQNHYSQALITGAVTYRLAQDIFNFDYNLGDENTQYPGALTATQVREDRRQANNHINFFKDNNGFLHLQYKHYFNENWHAETDLSHRFMTGNGILFLDFTQSRHTNFIKPTLKGNAFNTEWIAGGDFQQDQYSLTSLLGLTQDHQEKYGLFALATHPLVDKMAFSLGGRLAQQNSHLVQSPTISNDLNRAAATTLGLTYKPAPNLQLYARRAGSFRFPKADENASTTQPGGLKTQRGVAYEAGIEQILDKDLYNFDIFQLNLRDEIMFDPTQTPEDPFGSNRNLPPTKRYGFSLSFKKEFTPHLTLNSQFNYVNARFQSGVNANKRIPLVSELIMRAGLNYQITDKWQIYSEALFTGNQYAANDDANIAGVIGGYTTYNIHFSYIYKQISASFHINNLFNKYYYFYTVYQSSLNEQFFYPAPARNFMFTIKYLFE